MTHGNYGGDPFNRDPFAKDPFGGAGGPASPAVQPPSPQGDSHVMATLSIVFAFLCAPVGAILGHVALTQDPDKRGRDLALVGVTLSYVFITVAVVVWIVVYTMSD